LLHYYYEINASEIIVNYKLYGKLEIGI
jgi:hypothetical protein